MYYKGIKGEFKYERNKENSHNTYGRDYDSVYMSGKGKCRD